MTEYPRTAYLVCEYTGKGMFPSESIFKFTNSQGNIIRGFFQNSAVIGGDAKAKLLEVRVSREYSDGTALIHLPQKSPVYGNPPSENQIVNRTQIIYKEEMKN